MKAVSAIRMGNEMNARMTVLMLAAGIAAAACGTAANAQSPQQWHHPAPQHATTWQQLQDDWLAWGRKRFAAGTEGQTPFDPPAELR